MGSGHRHLAVRHWRHMIRKLLLLAVFVVVFVVLVGVVSQFGNIGTVELALILFLAGVVVAVVARLRRRGTTTA